jgi:hypothetical protein
MQMHVQEQGVGHEEAASGIPAGSLGAAHRRKAARSNPSGSCLELAEMPDVQIAMRNSRNPSGPALIFSRTAIATFLAMAKEGGLRAP